MFTLDLAQTTNKTIFSVLLEYIVYVIHKLKNFKILKVIIFFWLFTINM